MQLLQLLLLLLLVVVVVVVVVVVIFGVLSAVDIPASFAQTPTAKIIAANQAFMAAARACAACQITCYPQEMRTFTPATGGTGSCGVPSSGRDFTSDRTRFPSLTTQAVARVASSSGAVTLGSPVNYALGNQS